MRLLNKQMCNINVYANEFQVQVLTSYFNTKYPNLSKSYIQLLHNLWFLIINFGQPSLAAVLLILPNISSIFLMRPLLASLLSCWVDGNVADVPGTD